MYKILTTYIICKESLMLSLQVFRYETECGKDKKDTRYERY